jgi:uncharacterized protein YybS (DUF2232 family)
MTFNKFFMCWCLFFTIVDLLFYLDGKSEYLIYFLIQFCCFLYFTYHVFQEEALNVENND